jgi:tripartite-type tricarboxylate transporter receptor subunit TctC
MDQRAQGSMQLHQTDPHTGIGIMTTAGASHAASRTPAKPGEPVPARMATRAARWVRIGAVVLGSLGLAWSPAYADTYPSKPVKIVVPVPPGGANDMLARIIGQQLQQRLGQAFVIDNKGGASGVLGTNEVAKAAPDGYTLLLTYGGPVSSGLALLKSVPYQAERDLVAVSRIAEVYQVMVVSPKLNVSTLKDVVSLCHAKPNTLNASVNVPGSMAHLLTAKLGMDTKCKFTSVAYKGTGPALNDLLGGHVDFTIDTFTALVPHVNAGKLKAVAVSSAQRAEQLPNVPSFKELGYKDLEVATWFALFAPAATPPAVVTRLNREMNEILQMKEVRKAIADMGATPAQPNTVDEAKQFVHEEAVKWARVVREAGIAAN